MERQPRPANGDGGRDRVRIKLEQGAAARQYHQRVAVCDDQPAQTQHPPGTIPDFGDPRPAPYELAVHLQEPVPQLVHALEQRVLLDDRLAKREQRGGGQRHGCDRNDRTDTQQKLAGKPYELGEARFPGERQDVAGRRLEPRAQRQGRAEVPRDSPVPFEPAGQESDGVADEVGDDCAELDEPAGSVSVVNELANERTVLEHAVVVQCDRHEPDVSVECRVGQGAADVVEQAQFRRPQFAVARQATFGENPLRHAVAGDELDVALEHGVIQRLTEPPPDKVGPERLEDILERPGTCPLPDGVAHVHAPGEHVCHDDVVGIGPVIHEVDDHVALRDPLEGALVLVIDTGFVQDIDENLRDVVTDFVIRQDVEMGNDFVQVFPNLPPHYLLRELVLGHVALYGGGDRGIVGQGRARQTAFLQLVTVQAGAKLVD